MPVLRHFDLQLELVGGLVAAGKVLGLQRELEVIDLQDNRTCPVSKGRRPNKMIHVSAVT